MTYQMNKIHYPATFLVEGGPPLDVNCPGTSSQLREDEPLKLSCLITGDRTARFYICMGDHILVESNDYHDVLAYFKTYMTNYIVWAAELSS